MFNLMMHSTHFIYGYMMSDTWLMTIIEIMRNETAVKYFMRYSSSRGSFIVLVPCFRCLCCLFYMALTILTPPPPTHTHTHTHHHHHHSFLFSKSSAKRLVGTGFTSQYWLQQRVHTSTGLMGRYEATTPSSFSVKVKVNECLTTPQHKKQIGYGYDSSFSLTCNN